VAVLDVGMKVSLSRVSGDRGSIFLSLPSSVTQGVSLLVELELFTNSMLRAKRRHNIVSS
jgi:hypothetical protein